MSLHTHLHLRVYLRGGKSAEVITCSKTMLLRCCLTLRTKSFRTMKFWRSGHIPDGRVLNDKFLIFHSGQVERKKFNISKCTHLEQNTPAGKLVWVWITGLKGPMCFLPYNSYIPNNASLLTSTRKKTYFCAWQYGIIISAFPSVLSNFTIR